jgi:hypothetical protein
MTSPAVKSLVLVVAMLAAMGFAKARSPGNPAPDSQPVQIAARAVTS